MSFVPYQPHEHGNRDPAVTLRPAVAAEAATIVDLESRVRGSAQSREAMADAIADPLRLVVVAVADGEVVGWGKTHHWDWSDGPAEAGHYLGGVTVDPRCRRRGVATRLTAARMAWISERARTAWYVVNAQNRASIDLHRAWGFEEVARAEKFHTIRFSGGAGVLLRAALGADVARAASGRRDLR